MKYIKGDATKPIGFGPKMIVHVCNNQGGWGKGFVVSISNRWKQPEESYRELCKTVSDPMGDVQHIRVEEDIWVTNMICQKGYGKNNLNRHKSSKEYDTEIPLQYDVLEKCLKLTCEFAKKKNCSIHMPKIGSGLAGGDWDIIEKLIKEYFQGLDVYVYEL